MATYMTVGSVDGRERNNCDMMIFSLIGLIIIHLLGLGGKGQAIGQIKSFQSPRRALFMNPVTPFQNERTGSFRRTRSSHLHLSPLFMCDKSVARAGICANCVATKCKDIIPVDYRRARCGLALALPEAGCLINDETLVSCFRCFTEVCPAECNADSCNCCETAGPICSASNCGNCTNICDICQQSCPSSCPGDSCEYCATWPCSAMCHTSDNGLP